MKTLSLIITIPILLLNTSHASSSCAHDDKNFRCVKYIKNYDADTITFDIPNTHPLLGKSANIRVNGIDTPELRTKNKCEKAKGFKAKNIVQDILKSAKRIDLSNIQKGKYFRIVADVIVDGKSLAQHLLKSGLAYSYDGGTKEKVDWCKYRNLASEEKGGK